MKTSIIYKSVVPNFFSIIIFKRIPITKQKMLYAKKKKPTRLFTGALSTFFKNDNTSPFVIAIIKKYMHIIKQNSLKLVSAIFIIPHTKVISVKRITGTLFIVCPPFIIQLLYYKYFRPFKQFLLYTFLIL